MILLFLSHCKFLLEKVGKLLWWRGSRLPSTSSTSISTTVTSTITGSSEMDPEYNYPPDLTGFLTKESPNCHPIAHGSFGDVWKCTLDRHAEVGPVTVAVKSVRLKVADDNAKANITQILLNDFRARKQLQHKNLLSLLGFSDDFGRLPAMVFPWMHNGSLATYLQRSTELTIESKLRILWQVAAAINYLHLKGIVHGDLTANNILIDANHDAYVSDHGILTMCSELCGTSYIRSNVRWAAPELFEVPENLPNSASDVYSFGCIMFQVMTGQPPFADVQSNHAVALQIFAGEKPQRPSNPSVAESFWDFIETCWRDAGGRPSAADVVSFLELVQRNL